MTLTTIPNEYEQYMSNQIKSNQIKSNQIKSNQIKSNQIKSNRIHTYERQKTVIKVMIIQS